MLCLNGGLFPKPKLSSFCALVFRRTVILLLLADSCRGQSQGSSTKVAFVGEDVILPCHLVPALDAVSKTLEWGRPDLQPRFVHVWHDGQNLFETQNPSYRGRTSLSVDKLKQGDLSLKLSAVKLSDNGTYRCYFPDQSKESFVALVVGSVSSPVMAEIYINSSIVVLRCESAGWYPEPEVFWLDGEGNLLSAGPTETVRGPDDLYTVSSRVTVEKKHSNRFTCRVQQKNIDQTKETQIEISVDCFMATSSFDARVSILLVIFLIFILGAAFIVWKLRKETRETKMHREAENRERALLLEERKKEDLEEKRGKLEDLEQVVRILEEQSKEMKKQAVQLEHQMDDMQTKVEDLESKIQSVDKIQSEDLIGEKGRYNEMKEIALTAKNQLKDRKQKDQQQQTQIQTQLNKTNGLLNRMIDKKKEAENRKKTLSEELEEIQRKLQSEHKQETLD